MVLNVYYTGKTMLIEIKDLLNEAQIAKIIEMTAPATFVDGRHSAGKLAAQIKNNEEVQLEVEKIDVLNRVLMSALGYNELFKSAALPNQMADFIISRSRQGMGYGEHVDDPIMGGAGRKFRTDLSMTIFLNEPNEYEGGELLIKTQFGEQSVKLKAGSAILYPSSSLHQVTTVKSGERLVALTWMQSFVADAAKREILYELDQVRESLIKEEPESKRTKQINISYANLLRMWTDL